MKQDGRNGAGLSCARTAKLYQHGAQIMSEETTRDMPDAGSFEDRVFAELAAMRIDFTARFDGLEARSTTLEDKVDARLHETRPIWEAMQARLTEIGSTLEEMNSSMSLLVSDLFKTRARVAKLEERRPA